MVELIQKPYVFRCEGFSVQIGKNSCGCCKSEGQPIGIKCLIRISGTTVVFVSSVFSVSGKRMPEIREVRPDLMGPAGEQIDFQKRAASPLSKDAVAGADGSRACIRCVGNIHAVLLFVFFEKGFQCGLFFCKDAVYNAKVGLFQFPVLHFFI